MTHYHRTAVAASLLALVALAAPALAQEPLVTQGLAQQSLRAYWHVFIAYALVIVLVVGYVVSIARRLADVEKRMRE
jgi:CcmD family protein